MIEIQLYRLRSGFFSARKCHAEKKVSKDISVAVSSGNYNYKKAKYFTVKFLLIIVLACLLVLVHLDHSSNILHRLTLAGHKKLNHGTNEIIRLVQGSFNQGNVVLLGETADRHCVCNILHSIRWSIIRRICYWKAIDLDYVLVEDNKLYKSLKVQTYRKPLSANSAKWSNTLNQFQCV